MKNFFIWIFNILMITSAIFAIISTAFRKSTYSAGMGQCVEVGTKARELITVRDSKEEDGTQISVSSAGWRDFVRQVKLGKISSH